MHQQNQIKRTLALPDSIEVVRALLNAEAYKNRASVSKAVCQHFNFSDARGRPQIGGCVKALRELERVGHFVLPAPSKAKTLKKPRRLDCAVPNPVEVPAQAGDVRGLALVKVDSVDLMRIWNEMMLREHPQGAGPWWAANCATSSIPITVGSVALLLVRQRSIFETETNGWAGTRSNTVRTCTAYLA